MMMNEEGVVSLKVQYIDGTKIESVANKYTFVWKGSIEPQAERVPFLFARQTVFYPPKPSSLLS